MKQVLVIQRAEIDEKGFEFECNKKIGVKYSRAEKSIYFYKDGEKYLFYDNYVMTKNYRAYVTFNTYNFKK
jgi:hypothetical protein